VSKAALLLAITELAAAGHPAMEAASPPRPDIPKTWDQAEVASVTIPLATRAASPVPISADYYYRMLVRPVYRSYPVYAPDREPRGYLDSLRRLPLSVGTDPGLTLLTRRVTGYYKVPSLKGVWYRGPFEHNGSVAALEDWFDPRRMSADYVPRGFRGAGVTARAVVGHPFGLSLSDSERALIAFLRTL